MEEKEKEYKVMDQKEFKLFFKNKSPLLYAYLLQHVISAKVAEEMLTNTFARFYRIRTHQPQSLSKEKWLILICKKFMVDYFTWRTTEEGQQLTDSGLSSFECSHLSQEHSTQLTEWIQSCSEAEQVKIQEAIMSELPPPEVRFSVKDSIQEKLKDIEAKYGKKK